MRKRLTLIILAAMMLSSSFAQTPSTTPDQTQIPLTTEIVVPGKHGNPYPHAPLNPPHAYLSGNVITLTSHADFEVEILQNDAIVYTDYLPSGTDTLQLPDSLSGEYEIRFYTDSFVFIGYFEI